VLRQPGVNPIEVSKYINNIRNDNIDKYSCMENRVVACGRTETQTDRLIVTDTQTNRQTGRQTERHDTVISRFSHYCKST